MQVKKFEARSMKEALEMIKVQMGPDAIILSVRDNKKGYGLAGETSVEVTAAVAEDTLHKKKFVESRLRESDREKFQQSSAKSQKEAISKFVDKYNSRKDPNKVKTPEVRQSRYIDIENDGHSYTQQNYASIPQNPQYGNSHLYPDQGQVSVGNQYGTQRYAATNNSAVQRPSDANQFNRPAAAGILRATPEDVAAFVSGRGQGQQEQGQTGNSSDLGRPQFVESAQQRQPQMQNHEIHGLKQEIASLRDVISSFGTAQTRAGLYPGADHGVPFELSHLFAKLSASGLDESRVVQALDELQQSLGPAKLKNRTLVESWVARYFMDRMRVNDSTNVVGIQNGLHVFVGPSGAGKTSMMIKMAAQKVVKEKKKIALLTTDTVKVGALDQMKIYAQILNVPFAVIRNQRDWAQIQGYISRMDAVFVDYPGRSLKNTEEILNLQQMMPPSIVDSQIHLVLSANSKNEDLMDAGRRYAVTGFNDVIFTGLDETQKSGSIYNFMDQFKVRLHSFGIGPKVPEDYEVATKERLLDLIFKISQEQKAKDSDVQIDQRQQNRQVGA